MKEAQLLVLTQELRQQGDGQGRQVAGANGHYLVHASAPACLGLRPGATLGLGWCDAQAAPRVLRVVTA